MLPQQIPTIPEGEVSDLLVLSDLQCTRSSAYVIPVRSKEMLTMLDVRTITQRHHYKNQSICKVHMFPTVLAQLHYC